MTDSQGVLSFQSWTESALVLLMQEYTVCLTHKPHTWFHVHDDLGKLQIKSSNHGSPIDNNITYLSASLPVGDTAMLVLFTVTFCMRPGLVSVRWCITGQWPSGRLAPLTRESNGKFHILKKVRWVQWMPKGRHKPHNQMFKPPVITDRRQSNTVSQFFVCYHKHIQQSLLSQQRFKSLDIVCKTKHKFLKSHSKQAQLLRFW